MNLIHTPTPTSQVSKHNFHTLFLIHNCWLSPRALCTAAKLFLYNKKKKKEFVLPAGPSTHVKTSLPVFSPVGHSFLLSRRKIFFDRFERLTASLPRVFRECNQTPRFQRIVSLLQKWLSVLSVTVKHPFPISRSVVPGDFLCQVVTSVCWHVFNPFFA